MRPVPGSISRSAYVELEPGQSHDIGLPFRLRRAGLRSLYEPEAVASELAAPTTSAEWERKVRMLSRSWNDVLRGGLLDPRDQPAPYFAELISHRLLRYASGPLHVVVLLAALALATTTRSARAEREPEPQRVAGDDGARAPRRRREGERRE